MFSFFKISNAVNISEVVKPNLESKRYLTDAVDELDAKIKPYLGRLPEELDPIEKAIMRLATFELTERIDVPFRVIINESIELAKAFGAEDSHKFVNGALDKAVKTLRQHERSSALAANTEYLTLL